MSGSPAGPGSWVGQALAQQEEHIKRNLSCGGPNTMRAHVYEQVTSGSATWSACKLCGVTQTDADYQIEIQSR